MAKGSDLHVLAEVRERESVALPPPRADGPLSVEAAIARRRSVRDFARAPITLEAISQLLWSAGGITGAGFLRAAPSAGARYPLEIYLACEQGLFHYLPRQHSLTKVQSDDIRQALCDAAHGQEFVADAAVSIIFAAVYERTTDRYDQRGIRYVHIDVGHAAENVHLQAEALGFGSCPVGAFADDAVAEVLNLPAEQKPVYIVPVGVKGTARP